MANGIGPPPKPVQTSTGRWLYYLVGVPWLQLMTGLVLILLAKTDLPALSLFGGVAISLYAVALLAGTVCSFGSPGRSPISDEVKKATECALQIVVILSIVFVILWQTDNVKSTRAFLGAQAILVLIAVPFSWKARA